MFLPFGLFVFDMLLWWLTVELHKQLGIPVFTDAMLLISFTVFLYAMAEFTELSNSIDGDVVDDSKAESGASF